MQWQKKIKTAVFCCIFTLYTSALNASESLNKLQAKENTFWALCYHDAQDILLPEPKKSEMLVTAEHLAQHFEWLKRNGYTPVSIEQIIQARQGKITLPEKAILLSFDDGYVNFYETIYPLLKLYQYPAVFAVVSSWLEPEAGKMIKYGKTLLPRKAFLSWDQIKEMQASGLVEIASHSHDHHKGILGNPQGNEQAAFVTRQYNKKTKTYETDKQWEQRVYRDLKTSSDIIKQKTGKAPRVIVWPYGRYNQALNDIAKSLGMPISLRLNEKINHVNDNVISRFLISGNPYLSGFRYALNPSTKSPPQRIIHIDLDYIYDKNPEQQEKNLDLLLERILAMGVRTVYLQAFADPDGDGNADALYFPNRHLPVRADLFNRVAWQIYTRTKAKQVFAWMPVSSFVFPGDEELQVKQFNKGKVELSGNNYQRLSIFNPKARKLIKEIYADLGKHAFFNGLLFHDDAILTDHEDVGLDAMQYYQKKGLPADINNLRSPQWMDKWAQIKTQAITDFTLELAETARQYHPILSTARNIYAEPILNTQSQTWFAQSLENMLQSYDYVAVMAMPYMENTKDPKMWFKRLISAIKKQAKGNMDKIVFELQTQDWRNQKPIPSQTLYKQMEYIKRLGIRHYGYYPDNFYKNHPVLNILKPTMSLDSELYKAP